jgi:hypothetical protein
MTGAYSGPYVIGHEPTEDTHRALSAECAGCHEAWPCTVEQMRRTILALVHNPGGEHIYLSTGCLHDKHAYCQAMVGAQGEKRPASCKFCGAPCVCPCHPRRSEPSQPIGEMSEPPLGSTVRVTAGAHRGQTYERKDHQTLPGCDGEVWWVEHRYAWATWAQVQRLVGDDPWEVLT